MATIGCAHGCPLSSVAARAGRDQIPPSPASIGVKLFAILLRDLLGGPQASRRQPNPRHWLLPSPTSPAHRLTESVGRMPLHMISCCPLKNIGTKLVLKNLLRVPIRNNNESKYPPEPAVHYCTLGRIVLFLPYRVFTRSDGLSQNCSLQQRSEFEKSHI